MDDTVLLLPKFTVDEIAQHTRFLILSLPNNEMSRKSPFIIHKALLGIGGEPKSIKITIRTLNSCRGVISESDLYTHLKQKFWKVFLTRGVTQVCSCRAFFYRLYLEPKCINCFQPHTADSKLCPKWKKPKSKIQETKTNRNITYVEARKLVVPQTSHTYAQAAKSSNKTSSQTDENITKIKCPPLELLQPLSSTTRTTVSISTPDVSTSSSSTQAQLLPSTSSISTSNSES
ncbi:uncharacterized protein TNCV_3731721 [Trichonephila clavipes]|nr:uncharacterized protein TNCV_3731721 [Trichonephila clavipes]